MLITSFVFRNSKFSGMEKMGELDYEKKFGHRFDVPDYNSDNAKMMNVEEMKQLLLTLDYVRERLAEFGISYD